MSSTNNVTALRSWEGFNDFVTTSSMLKILAMNNWGQNCQKLRDSIYERPLLIYSYLVSKLDCEDFHTVLETLKADELARLTVLEIVNSRGSLDLFKVSNSFPNLEVFEIYYSTSVHVSFKENFKFPRLKKLIIYDTEVSGAASEAILSSCPQIVTLTLAHCEEVTDEIFFQILEKNPMKNCQDLSLLFAPLLSSDSLRYIISCLEK